MNQGNKISLELEQYEQFGLKKRMYTKVTLINKSDLQVRPIQYIIKEELANLSMCSLMKNMDDQIEIVIKYKIIL